MSDDREPKDAIITVVAKRLQASEDRITKALTAVTSDVEELRARVDATHSIMTKWHHVENSLTAKMSATRLDIGDLQKSLKRHDSWAEATSQKILQLQERDLQLTEAMGQMASIGVPSLAPANDDWKEAHSSLEATVMSMAGTLEAMRASLDKDHVRIDQIIQKDGHNDLRFIALDAMSSSIGSIVDADHQRLDDFESILHHKADDERLDEIEESITMKVSSFVEQDAWKATNLKLWDSVGNLELWKEANLKKDTAMEGYCARINEELKTVTSSAESSLERLARVEAGLKPSAEQGGGVADGTIKLALEALNDRIDLTNEGLAELHESNLGIENSLSQCLNEVSMTRSEFQDLSTGMGGRLNAHAADFRVEISKCRSDLEKRTEGIEARMKIGGQKLMEAFMGSCCAEAHSADTASRRPAPLGERTNSKAPADQENRDPLAEHSIKADAHNSSATDLHVIV